MRYPSSAMPDLPPNEKLRRSLARLDHFQRKAADPSLPAAERKIWKNVARSQAAAVKLRQSSAAAAPQSGPQRPSRRKPEA